MKLDEQIKESPQPYTYRQWIHDACAVEYGDENYYTDEQLDHMTDEELDDLEAELEICGEGSSREGGL
jgi:hypothetical protein